MRLCHNVMCAAFPVGISATTTPVCNCRRRPHNTNCQQMFVGLGLPRGPGYQGGCLRMLCAQVRDYLLALESHLSEAHRQASRLTAKEVELGEAMLEFGQVGR